jgi:hypothetical protein
MRETPTILDAGHAHTVYGLGNLNAGTAFAGNMTVGNLGGGLNQGFAALGGLAQGALGQGGLGLQQQAFNIKQQVLNRDAYAGMAAALNKPNQKETPMSDPTRRLVQVFIADSDENVPLENSLLYTGGQKLTDLTDQELFFEIDIKSILAEHNAKRVTFINKKVKERTEQLEPARIRDLKMVVVTVAGF